MGLAVSDFVPLTEEELEQLRQGAHYGSNPYLPAVSTALDLYAKLREAAVVVDGLERLVAEVERERDEAAQRFVREAEEVVKRGDEIERLREALEAAESFISRMDMEYRYREALEEK